MIAIVHGNVGGQHDLRAFRKPAGHFDMKRVRRACCNVRPADGAIRLEDVHAFSLLFLADGGFRNGQRVLDYLRQDECVDIRTGQKLLPLVMVGAEDLEDLPRAQRHDLRG